PASPLRCLVGAGCPLQDGAFSLHAAAGLRGISQEVREAVLASGRQPVNDQMKEPGKFDVAPSLLLEASSALVRIPRAAVADALDDAENRITGVAGQLGPHRFLGLVEIAQAELGQCVIGYRLAVTLLDPHRLE